MQHTFSQVPKAQIQRSSFDRSHGHKTAISAGYLYPIFVDEVLPGDTFNLNMTTFARLSTPLTPFMDNMYLDSFFFAVPIRLIWDNWQKFNGEQTNPGDTTDFLVPQVVAGPLGFIRETFWDYIGIPPDAPSANLSVCAFWSRAYNLIWNEWFRDQNLQDSLVVDKDDGPDNEADYAMCRKRGKRHDYFTSCLPWPQKGPAVELPLGLSAPVTGLYYYGAGETISGGASGWYDQDGVAGVNGTNLKVASSGSSKLLAYEAETSSATSPLNVVADLSEATAATINSLRNAFQIQRLYERDARGGTRYTEIIKSHFGVTSPDARLQRPEYLGGGSSPIQINPIAQTSASDSGTTPQGNLAAMGTVSGRAGFTKSFTEHCVVLGLVSVRADLTYQQGLNRMFSRRTRWDFYWPALAHIGEQAVLNKEIYLQGTSADDDVFGYQERYAEYRYKPSIITGEMRSDHPQSLDVWHLAQDFASLPTLNSTFIEENPPVERVLAVQEYAAQFILDSHFNLKCARPMPVYSVPGLIDHF